MQKKLTEKQLYTAKLKHLRANYQEVKPLDFYRDIFPTGSFDPCGKYEGKANGILIKLPGKSGEKIKHRHVFDDLQEIKSFQGEENVIMSPIGYYGKRRTSRNASWIYALVFDLDGQELGEMTDTLHQMYTVSVIPPATYVVLSGHGLHLYYVFDEPVAMKSYVQRELNKLKTGLTKLIWNRYTSTLEKQQFQPITQGFRVVGSQSKLGKRYPVRAFLTGRKTSVRELAAWIPKDKDWDKYRANIDIDDRVPIEQAKTLWPDWYERRVIQGKPANRWVVKRDLYDWWLRKLRADGNATVGHRYFCIMCLAIYAYKCMISFDELRQDAYSLIPFFDELSDKDENRFTKKDVDTALQAYHDGSNNYTRDFIKDISGIEIVANKRNYRTQEEHIKIMSAVRDIVKPNGSWRNKEGRPKKQAIIQAWRKNNPGGKKIDCHRETGIDPKTIRKWWDS